MRRILAIALFCILAAGAAAADDWEKPGGTNNGSQARAVRPEPASIPRFAARFVFAPLPFVVFLRSY